VKPISVMQVTDTLAAGGAERIAVSFANALPRDRFSSHLCTTRASGPLAGLLQPDVERLELCRRTTLDMKALVRARSYILEKGISVLHAHGTAVYFAVASAFLARNCLVVWHAHYGCQAEQTRAPWPLRLAARRVAGIIAVSSPLAEWARTRLGVPADRVWCVPNFVVEPLRSPEPPALPGTPGKRIVCVANLRPEKDPLTLLDAMKQVVESDPAASLLLVGSEADPAYAVKVKERVHHQGLADSVFFLGSQSNVSSILRGCDIGVMSSASEGMPLALLEYGMANLPTVATRVGQVPEMLDEGRAGILVAPGQPGELAAALLKLLQSPELRQNLGGKLKQRVREHYSEAAVMPQILRIYETVLSPLTAQK
jgi:glycosyltransferase involved in cell wall biosynthesis